MTEPRLCLWCKDEIPEWANRGRKFCDHKCAMLAWYDRQHKHDPIAAPAHVLNPDQIRCNHCGQIMESARALRAHKQSLGLTRTEEQRSEFGSSMENCNA